MASSKSEQSECSFAEKRQTVVERRMGLDRRRGPGKRRSTDRISAEEGHMSDEQFEFLMAIDQYKKQNQRPFPTWTEVLDLIRAMGYRKVAVPSELDTNKCEEAEVISA